MAKQSHGSNKGSGKSNYPYPYPKGRKGPNAMADNKGKGCHKGHKKGAA